jgi:hypothetical protein
MPLTTESASSRNVGSVQTRKGRVADDPGSKSETNSFFGEQRLLREGASAPVALIAGRRYSGLRPPLLIRHEVMECAFRHQIVSPFAIILSTMNLPGHIPGVTRGGGMLLRG